MGKLITIIFGMILISCVSAVEYNLTAGESINRTLPEEYDYYSIVGNSTPIDLNITQEGTIVTISTNKYLPTDSFSIIFFNREKEVIHHYSGGSSTRKVYVDKNITEYIILENNITIPCQNQTDIIDLTPEEKSWLNKFWEWICHIIKKILANRNN